jgi:hypothetical protein
VEIASPPARAQSKARLGPFVLLLSYVDDGLGPGHLSIVVRLRGQRLGYVVNDSLELEGPPRSGQPRTIAPTLPANQFGNSFLGMQAVEDPTSNAILVRVCEAT